MVGMLLLTPSLKTPDLRTQAFQAGLNLGAAGKVSATVAQGSSKQGPSKKGLLFTLGVAVVVGTVVVLLKGEPREHCWMEGGIDPAADYEEALSRFRCETR